MRDNIKWIEDIAPDFLKILSRRYQILQQIKWMAPVGRRTLGSELGMSERSLRTETDLLKNTGVIKTSKSGMSLTLKGEEILISLKSAISDVLDISEDERRLSDKLGIERTIIVPGDSLKQQGVINSFGKVIEDILNSTLSDGKVIISVTGGNTMYNVAEGFTPDLSKHRDLMFVPARGGIGGSVEIQANAISALMAEKTKGKHKSLYVPEDLSEKGFESLLSEPSIKSVVTLIKNCDVVIHSIGDAETMAKRRNLPAEAQQLLHRREAVTEAFGDFFNKEGDLVYKIPRIGLHVRDLNKIKYVISVAGGADKALAIEAYMKNAPRHTILVTDEGASKAILRDNP